MDVDVDGAREARFDAAVEVARPDFSPTGTRFPPTADDAVDPASLAAVPPALSVEEAPVLPVPAVDFAGGLVADVLEV